MNSSTSDPEARGFETSLAYIEHSRPARPRLKEKPKQNNDVEQRNKTEKATQQGNSFCKKQCTKTQNRLASTFSQDAFHLLSLT